MALEGKIEIPYQWATGHAVGGFLEGLSLGQLRGSRCTGCARVLVPAIRYCACGADTEPELVQVGPAGLVELIVPIHRTAPFSPFPAPHRLGLIRLEGADSLFLHRLLDDAATTGQQVRPVFRDRPQGDLLDLKGFR